MNTFLSPLSSQEEMEYFCKMNQGDLDAKRMLIEHNLRLVAHVCKKYQSSEEEMEDLISIGSIGLIKAISTFDTGKGNRLAAYASRCIENELLMHFRAKKKLSREVSLYEPIGTDKEGNQIQLLDVIENDEIEIEDSIELQQNMKRLYQLLPKVLNAREKRILILRYGLYNQRPMTQREISSTLGISRSYVSRIEKKAVEKLRQAMQLKEVAFF